MPLLSFPPSRPSSAAAAAAAASSNPYLQSLYAASAYPAGAANGLQAGGGLIPLPAVSSANGGMVQQHQQSQLAAMAGSQGAAAQNHHQASSGNPLLDAYNQYAALMAAGYGVPTTVAMGTNMSGLDAMQQVAAGGERDS